MAMLVYLLCLIQGYAAARYTARLTGNHQARFKNHRTKNGI